MNKDNKDILIVVILGLGILIGYISGQYDAYEDMKSTCTTEKEHSTKEIAVK
jgi:hypothetical protein